MKNTLRLILLSVTLLGAVLNGNLAGTPAYALSRKSAEAHPTGDPDAAAKRQVMILEPFYLIQEQAAKVWIERVVMILELNPSHKLSIDPNNAKHRSVLFEILVADSETEALPAKVQAAMNQTLGIPAISSVHLRRSFLLF